jgi:hypothetical protein
MNLKEAPIEERLIIVIPLKIDEVNLKRANAARVCEAAFAASYSRSA